MVKYLDKFIAGESELSAPLRGLMKEEVPWEWYPEHDDAMQQIKDKLISAPTLSFYDVNKSVTIQADASQNGLGACLLQEGKPVAFASRALTPAEQNYAQLEKELLCVTFACAKFHQYIYGKKVEIQNDHKPLEIIMKKPLACASALVQRMMLRLQRYELKWTWCPGNTMHVSDALSRAYIEGAADQELIDDIEVMVYSVRQNFPASDVMMDRLVIATQEDLTMQRLIQVIGHGWPEKCSSLPADLESFWNIRDELTCGDGLVYAGQRLIVPTAMRKEFLEVLHESHQGIDKTRARARGVIYWPGINRDISDMIERCATCLIFARSNSKEPLIPHPVPDGPFQHIAMDILTYAGRDYLVAVDCYSKYPELARIEYKTAECVIAHVKGICARHGIPTIIYADNQPFNSHAFINFANSWGITVTTSSPGFPQSNGQAEIYVSIVKQLMKKAEDSGKDPYIALLEYRNTPVSGMKHSPAQLAMSRMLRSKLPTRADLLKPQVVDPSGTAAVLRDRQIQYKSAYDRKAGPPLTSLQPGDVVRHRRNGVWEPVIVTSKHGSPRSYIIRHEDGELRRNRRHLLKSKEEAPLFLPPTLNVPPPTLSVAEGSATPAPSTLPPRQPVKPDTLTKRSAAANSSDPNKHSNLPPTVTSSGRQVKFPTKYDDFVMPTR